MKRILTLIILTLTITSPAQALIFSTGAGSAVTRVDRSANFGTLTSSGLPLANYSENLLDITVNDITFIDFDAFRNGTATGFHYGSSGNYSYVTVKASDNADIFGVEFLLGSGWSNNLGGLYWETYNNALFTGSGASLQFAGTTVGWSDLGGFDELRVGLGRDASYTSFGALQAIAIDDLNVQLSRQQNVIPEPASMILFGSGLIGAFLRKLKMA